MGDERMQILRMVEEGKVSAEEASKLLEAVGSGAPAGGKVGEPTRRRNRMLRIHVREGEGTKVNVNVPLDLARIALQFIPTAALKTESGGSLLDVEEIMRLLEEGIEGKIVDVVEESSNTRVEVLVE